MPRDTDEETRPLREAVERAIMTEQKDRPDRGKIALVYVGNDHYQTTERVPDDTPSGSDYWSCYIPRVIAKKLGFKPEQHKVYELILTDQTIALIEPLIEEAKKQEKHRVLDVVYSIVDSFEWKSIEQALKEEK